MRSSQKSNLYAALIHHPVLNKNGEVISSAVTNLDLHDIARAAATYEVCGFYVVTPLEDQIELCQQIIFHWVEGNGSVYNPARRRALERISIMKSYDGVLDDIRRREGSSPRTVVTSASDRQRGKILTFGDFREMLADGTPYVLNFGTAWGLTPEFIEKADYILEPIQGNGKYNHLSVRSAASIMFDRLLGHY